jgi:hypothetical protein
MMAAGVIGAVILGFLQDTTIDRKLRHDEPALHAAYATQEKNSIFGTYRAIDGARLSAASPTDQEKLAAIQNTARKEALRTVAIFPVIMLVAYISLIVYYRSTGGYKPIVLEPREVTIK